MRPYDEGREGYELGYTKDLNPFAHGSVSADEWGQGWLDAYYRDQEEHDL